MKKFYLVPAIKKHSIHGNEDLLVDNVGASKGTGPGSGGAKERGSFAEDSNTDFWGNSEE